MDPASIPWCTKEPNCFSRTLVVNVQNKWTASCFANCFSFFTVLKRSCYYSHTWWVKVAFSSLGNSSGTKAEKVLHLYSYNWKQVYFSVRAVRESIFRTQTILKPNQAASLFFHGAIPAGHRTMARFSLVSNLTAFSHLLVLARVFTSATGPKASQSLSCNVWYIKPTQHYRFSMLCSMCHSQF